MSAALFDTWILLDALRGVDEAGTELQRYSRRYLSRISWIEVMTHGLPGDAKRTESFLTHFTIVELSEEIARSSAQLRGQRRGLTLSNAIILASAQIAGHILVTRNTQAFPAQMPGIRIPYTIEEG
ncbi:PIN domain-containing protein [Altererythrobacter salegens]|uniref:PIN domain-containing protein n=1 Tax=Croceibacterium salegens TaxID=1737568 RepID=A0A6I4SQU6_9SPHN|nr:PIN domain-containing protein [Croceibacterium salegens]MXO58321.1 PIN domain-containing protein [Croceibacterium salegens]